MYLTDYNPNRIPDREYEELKSLYFRLLAKNARLVDENTDKHNTIIRLSHEIDVLRKALRL